jgi:hypothetical protein
MTGHLGGFHPRADENVRLFFTTRTFIGAGCKELSVLDDSPLKGLKVDDSSQVV